MFNLKLSPSGLLPTYICGRYIVKVTSSGGKVGKGKNITGSLQILEPLKNSSIIKKTFRFKVCDKVFYDKAEDKVLKWIELNP